MARPETRKPPPTVRTCARLDRGSLLLFSSDAQPHDKVPCVGRCRCTKVQYGAGFERLLRSDAIAFDGVEHENFATARALRTRLRTDIELARGEMDPGVHESLRLQRSSRLPDRDVPALPRAPRPTAWPFDPAARQCRLMLVGQNE